MTSRRLETFCALGLILLGSALLYQAAPLGDRTSCWTHTVLRNWEEYGLGELRGRLVCNPGGAGAREQPVIYGGHQPFVLYAALLIGQATGGAGRSGLGFHLVLCLVVALSTWRLLGGSRFGWLAAGAAVLSPGFLRFMLIIDPVTVPVMLGLPVALWTDRLLQRDRLSPAARLAVAALVAGYAVLNWTSAFALAGLLGYLLVALRGRAGRLLGFAVVAGLGILAAGAIAVLQKVAPGGSGGLSSLDAFYNTYLVGPGGYDGNPMSWGRAVARVGAACVAGLLPVLALGAAAAGLAARRSSREVWTGSLPLLAVLLTIAGMRNYFAHHPWMAAPVVLFGLILSMKLWLEVRASQAGPEAARASLPMRWPQWAFLVGCLVYGLALMLVLRVNSAVTDPLLRLTREHTARRDLLVYAADRDPWLAQNARRLGEHLDRRMLESGAAPPTAEAGHGYRRFLLATAPRPEAGELVARSQRDDFPLIGAVEGMLGWYRRHIARRATGDRLEAGTIFYLYRMP